MSAGTRPAFPRAPSRGLCALCGDRLIPGERPMTRVHELTLSVRCPPVARTCSVCERDGLIACSEPGCLVIGHPGTGPEACLRQCICCASWGCPAHVSPIDLLCTSCAARGGMETHEHEAAS